MFRMTAEGPLNALNNHLPVATFRCLVAVKHHRLCMLPRVPYCHRRHPALSVTRSSPPGPPLSTAHQIYRLEHPAQGPEPFKESQGPQQAPAPGRAAALTLPVLYSHPGAERASCYQCCAGLPVLDHLPVCAPAVVAQAHTGREGGAGPSVVCSAQGGVAQQQPACLAAAAAVTVAAASTASGRRQRLRAAVAALTTIAVALLGLLAGSSALAEDSTSD